MKNRKQNRLPSLTQLKEILRDCAFDPRVRDDPNFIIVETALSNVRYAEDRGKELITRAQAALDQPAKNPAQAADNLAEYKRLMQQGMGLLALAIAIRE